MGLFYTGKGDTGISEIGKRKVPKNSPVIEALGDLDELNSLLGVARSNLQNKQLAEKLQGVQKSLFIIQARVAWIMFPEYEAKQLSQDHIVRLEREIDAIEEKIQPERGFIISGEDPVAAHLDYVRAVARRTERAIDTLHKEHELPAEILGYMNRLSSYLYALARKEIFDKNIQEQKPTYQ
jgi:cob(I)alamin adenosyltransferase